MSTTYLPDVDVTTIKPHDSNARKDIADAYAAAHQETP